MFDSPGSSWSAPSFSTCASTTTSSSVTSGSSVSPSAACSPERASRERLALGELLDLLLGHALDTRQQGLDLPLGGVISQDQFLGLRSGHDVGHPVVETRRAPPGHGETVETHPSPAFDFCQWLTAGLHRDPLLLTMSTVRDGERLGR